MVSSTVVHFEWNTSNIGCMQGLFEVLFNVESDLKPTARAILRLNTVVERIDTNIGNQNAFESYDDF